jgi:hypothetical protein
MVPTIALRRLLLLVWPEFLDGAKGNCMEPCVYLKETMPAELHSGIRKLF